MIASRATRRIVLAGVTIALAPAAGCFSDGGSFASVSPFSQKPVTPGAAASESPSGITGHLASAGNKTKAAVVRTGGAIGNLFSRTERTTGSDLPEDDPLRLDNKPDRVDPEVFVAAGQLWESTGNFEKAMTSYAKALEQQNDHVPALTNIARLHFRQGNLKESENYFRRALAKKPDDPELHHDLGLALGRMKQYESAIGSMSRALELSPANSRYANNLATIHFDAGGREAAFAVLNEYNKPAVAHYNMAYLHFRSGQMASARGHLQESLRFEPIAANDIAIRRAVERSRKLLHQIDGKVAAESRVSEKSPEITPSGPQASIAARPAKITTNPMAAVGIAGETKAAAAAPAETAPAAPVPAPAAPPEPQIHSFRSGVTEELPGGFKMPAR